MSKQVAKAATGTTEVAAQAQGENLPAYLREKKMQGAGVSTSKDDILIPMARVLQPLSPEVLDGSQRIPGAAAGDIYIKNAPNPIIKATEGFIFQPCHFDTAVVEWKPRSQGGGGGGGLVAKHEGMPDDAVQKPDPQNPDRIQTVSSRTGNVYVDTRYHAGFIIDLEGAKQPMPCYIPLSSSGHSVSKAWMLLMSLKRMGGDAVDSFAIYYRFKTKMRTKNGKSWFTFDVTDAGPEVDGAPSTMWAPTEEDFERGLTLFQALEAGELALAEDEVVDETSQAGSARGETVGRNEAF